MIGIDELIQSLTTLSPTEAVSRIEAELDRYPDHQPDLYRRLGILHLEAGAPEQAIRSLTLALDRNPNDLLSLAHLGSIHAKLGQHAKAADDYRRIIETQSPSPHWAYVELGNQLERLGDLEGAILQFGHALTLMPSTQELRRRFIDIHRHLHQESAALRFLVQQFEQLTDHELRQALLVDMAELANLAKEFDRARHYCEQAMALPIEDPDLTERLATLDAHLQTVSPQAESASQSTPVPPEPPMSTAHPPAPQYPRLRGYLCLLTDTKTWYFARHRQWFTLANPDHLGPLLAAFPVRVLDSRDFSTLPCQGGTLRIQPSSTTSEPLVDFIQGNDQLLATETIHLDDSSLFFVEWRYGAYPDGWLAPQAELLIEGAATLELNLFLPQSQEAKHAKTLAIAINQQRVYEQPLNRGINNQIPVIELPPDRPVHQVQILSTPPELKGRDQRDLGVVFQHCRLNGIDYPPFLP